MTLMSGISRSLFLGGRFCLTLFVGLLLPLSEAIGAYSPYSNRELEQLEKEFVEQINQSDSVVRNPLAIEYINHLANTLARNGQMA